MLVIYLPILSTIFCIFANVYTLIINIFYLIYFSSSSKRPERLISKLKAMNLEDAARSGRKIVVLRQPKVSFGFSNSFSVIKVIFSLKSKAKKDAYALAYFGLKKYTLKQKCSLVC